MGYTLCTGVFPQDNDWKEENVPTQDFEGLKIQSLRTEYVFFVFFSYQSMCIVASHPTRDMGRGAHKILIPLFGRQ